MGAAASLSSVEEAVAARVPLNEIEAHLLKKNAELASSVDGKFPNSATAMRAGRAAHEALLAMGYDLDHVLYANSTCPDEVNRKGPWWDSLMGRDGRGPGSKMTFNLGGLAGLVAVGKTGFKACASHASPEGVIFVVVGPHAGVSDDVGKVLRANQVRSTGCCGAAVGALMSKDQDIVDDPDDAQMVAVKKAVKCIVATDHVSCVEGLYHNIWAKVCALVPGNLNNQVPVVVLGGIQINTDVGLPDFFATRNFALFDVNATEPVDKLDVFNDKLNTLL